MSATNQSNPRFMSRRLSLFGVVLTSLFWFIPVALLTQPAVARPPAHELVPKSTLAFVQIRSCPELVEHMKDTAVGRMSRDPRIAPLLKDLYGTVSDEYRESAQEAVGASLDELLKIPQGEIALAVIARENMPPAFIALLDVGDDPRAARTVLERIESVMIGGGADREQKTIGDVKLTILNPSDPNVEIAYFEREGTLVFGSALAETLQLLKAWNTQEGETLARNSSYQTIRARCHVSGEVDPHITFYVNPIDLVRNVTQGSLEARIGLAVLPALGLDGFRGVGGSVTLATEKYDDLVHLHVLLDNPRGGIIEMIALEPVEIEPDRWIPADVETYLAGRLNVQKFYTKLGDLVDSFQQPGTFKSQVQRRMSEPLNIDFGKDVIEALDGRFILLRSFQRPARPMAQPNSFAVKTKDGEAMRVTLGKIMSRFDEFWTKGNIRGIDYYQAQPPRFRDVPPESRPPLPCVAVLDDYLIIAQSEDFLRKLISTYEGTGERLADSIDYAIVSRRLMRQAGGREPSVVLVNRPEESFRYLYDLATSDATNQWLQESAQNNRFLKNVGSALDKNPLPPFEVLSKYLAPSGGVVVDDDTGFHYVGVTLRRESP